MKRFASLFCTAAVVSAALALAGCDQKQPEPTPDPKAAQPGAQPAAQPAQPGMQPAAQPAASPGAASAIGWTKPEAWKELTEKKPMRITTYEIPAAEGDSEGAEMSVSQAMGSVDANVKRWQGQFKDSPEAKTEKKTIAGFEVVIVEIEGAMRVGGGPMMGGGGEPKEGFKMLAAMVQTQPSAHFFKMWGPQKTVDAARGDFDAMLNSIGKK